MSGAYRADLPKSPPDFRILRGKTNEFMIRIYEATEPSDLLAEAFARLLPQLSDSEDQGTLQAEVLLLAEKYGVPVTYVEEPYCETMGEAELTIYPPLTEGDVNEEGLTILCTAGDFDVLITGDMGSTTEKLLVETYDLPDIEVLVVGHHGSKYATTEELLEAVTPEIGVISVGENNFGHPTAEAMDRMAWQGMTLYRTDLQGNIVIQAGGERN